MRKRIISIICMVSVMFSVLPMINVYAGWNPTVAYEYNSIVPSYMRGNCVYTARAIVPSLPTGITSLNEKRAIINSYIPKEGSIAIGHSWYTKPNTYYGHVSYVESVNNDGTITTIDGGIDNINCYRITATPHEMGIEGYWYPGGNPNPAPIQPIVNSTAIELNNPYTEYIDDDNAIIKVSVSNCYQTSLQECGAYLGKDASGLSLIASEQPKRGTKEIWYDIKNECGQTLEGGTTYYYKFYVVANGTTYYSDVQSFKTTGGVTIPTAPGNVNLSESKIAAGRNVTVTWDKITNADSYNVVLNYNGSEKQTISTPSTSASFNLSDAGTYTVSVSATNKAGTGPAKESSEVIAMPKQKVMFQVIKDGIFLYSINDDDEEWPKIISTQMVDWGTAAKTPTEPIREGYTFNGWDKDYSCITEGTTLTAQYRKRNYLVTFTDSDGTILSSQRIDYGDAADVPTDPTPPSGYVFVGWDSTAYQKITGRTNINAVYAWADESHPVTMEMTSATRNDAGSGYEISLNLTNIPTEPTKGRIIVNLKTQEGKMVANAIEEITLSASEAVTNKKLFVSYDGVATVAEVEFVGVVDSNKTGVPLANTVSMDIDLTTKWSDWTTTQVTGDYETESRTEYCYSDRSTTTSSSKTLAGWSLLKSTSSWGSWSEYSQTPVYASSTRQVDSYYVNPTYKTQWNYWGYQNSKYNTYCPYCGISNTWYAETGWLDYQISPNRTVTTYNCGRHPQYVFEYKGNGRYFYYETSRQVETSPGYTMYRYRDLKYTYYFDKWSDYSDWSTEPVTANENRAVETRTTYRYKAKDITSDMEDKNGEKRVIEGHVEVNAAGKQAVLMVYKKTNSDPTESQLEYIGETIIGDDGSYSFDCIMREEPTAQTGDFIAVLGIEGGIRPVYIDTIKAPTPVYTVQFTDADWNVISTQQVEAGQSAVAPEPTEVEGATFARWNEDYTNVNEDLIINPEYTKDKHTVIFVDNNNVYMASATYDHGDALTLPDFSNVEHVDYNIFTKWDAIENGITTVKEDMVVKAIYEPPVYTVTFHNLDGDVIISEQVKEGEAALVPEPPAVSGMVFDKWSGDMTYTSVYSDMDIYPVYSYEKTSATPEIQTSVTDEGKLLVTLSCTTTDADIYFTTDTSDPFDVAGNENASDGSDIAGTKYTGPFEIDTDTILSVRSYADGMNVSDLAVKLNELEGDINGDGIVNAKDIILLKQRIAEWELGDAWTEDYERRADVLGDEKVTSKDLTRLMQIVAEWD